MINSQIFGLAPSKTPALCLIPANWDVTVSFRDGCALSPQVMHDISNQIDVFDKDDTHDIWSKGIQWKHDHIDLFKANQSLRLQAKSLIEKLDAGNVLNENDRASLTQINNESTRVHQRIQDFASNALKSQQKVGLVGGDHSTALGNIQAHLDHYKKLSILQIDAHMDMYNAYQGFIHSHASVMYQVSTHTRFHTLTQVGIRDYSDIEYETVSSNKSISVFYDKDLAKSKAEGQSWSDICKIIIQTLSDNVYISFDIDGLSPDNCPNTGTPVPGGLSYNDAIYLMRSIAESGKTIVGFDLVEVSGKGNTDPIIGLHLLHELCRLVLR